MTTSAATGGDRPHDEPLEGDADNAAAESAGALPERTRKPTGPSPYFATAAKGTEGALRDELRELRIPGVKADRGGVHFGWNFGDAMRVCFESRIAIRVLERRGGFDAATPEALYEGVRAIDLSDVLDPERTLSVSATVKHGSLTHSGFVAQKAKDAIVDAQRAHFGRRSNVERDDPDVRINVHVAKDHAELFVDLAGEPLHRRGYRNEAREAPIKETLAAAMLRLAGWDRARPLVDPMCGSGTIAIEGALWARDIAPGLLRKQWSFERWARFGKRELDFLSGLREHAKERIKPESDAPSIMAIDVDAEAVKLTRKLCQRAGVTLRVEQLDVAEFLGTEPPGHLITNPPYGVRLERSDDFERSLARSFRALHGHRVTVICQDPKLREAMRIKPAQEHTLFNGDLECRLFTWDVP